MSFSHRIKGVTELAEKQMGEASNQSFATRKYLMAIGQRSRTMMIPKKTPKMPTRAASSSAVKKHATDNNDSVMANTLLWAHLIPPMPIIASTVYRHFTKGPPLKSWNLSTDITINIIRDFLDRCRKITVEEIQRMSSSKKLPIPSNIHRRKFTVPYSYRERAGNHIAKLFCQSDERFIGWDWEASRKDAPPLNGEWLQQKGNPLDPSKESTILYLHGGAYYLGTYGIYRQFLSRIIKYSHASTCSIDYRLAPQHPFPAALEDALATYLYLIDPPADDENQPIDPQKIVISGDSAGGGLTFALLLVIRDAGLPYPAGAMALSPWVDLTHSLPSIITNMMTDYLPPMGFKHAPSPALDYTRLPQKRVEAILNAEITTEKSDIDNKPSTGPFSEDISSHSQLIEDIDRIQFYASNEALKIPLVSPVFDKKNLRRLPRLLVQCGTAERLRDESIYTALKASNCYPGAQSDHSGSTNHVILELYEDQPHVFQLLFSNKLTSRAIKNLGAFVREVTCSPAIAKEKSLGYVTEDTLTIRKVDSQGKISDAKKEVLEKISSKTWANWEERLSRPSIKERMDEVNAAFVKYSILG
ncbi:Alpha/Beta hydrolase protein [Pilobolus umbonatus]|nr:Alpha/Beta hydrolase protein [Pilobolus umbonatus]